jgi:hypothetical protein
MELHLSNKCTTGYLLSDYGAALSNTCTIGYLLADYGAALA